MPAFEAELTARRGHPDGATHSYELTRIERVAARSGLGMHGYQVAVNRGKRSRVLAKSLKLGMVAITTRAATQHFARKQSLSPERDQALRVKILGM